MLNSYCLSSLNLATLCASLSQPLRFKSYISLRISLALLQPKNYLLYFSLFYLKLFYSDSSHSYSGSDYTERQNDILSVQSDLSSLAICSNFKGIFTLRSLKALQTYLSILMSVSQKRDQSYQAVLSFLAQAYSNWRLLHFLFTWSMFTATQSSKVRLAAHRSSYFLFILLRTFCRQGSTSLPNSLANSMSTFSDRSESLLAMSLNLLSPFLTIL